MIHPDVIEILKNATPTIEGLRRYAPDGQFNGRNCTCTSLCTLDCRGECECAACQELARVEERELVSA